MIETEPSNVRVGVLRKTALAAFTLAVTALLLPRASYGQRDIGYARDHLPPGYSREGYPLARGTITSVDTDGNHVAVRLIETGGQAWRMEYAPTSKDFVEKVRVLQGQSIAFRVFQSTDKVCIPECRGWIYDFISGYVPNTNHVQP